MQVPGFVDQDVDSIVSLWADFVMMRLAGHPHPLQLGCPMADITRWAGIIASSNF
jgi:hypothetical protein